MKESKSTLINKEGIKKLFKESEFFKRYETIIRKLWNCETNLRYTEQELEELKKLGEETGLLFMKEYVPKDKEYHMKVHNIHELEDIVRKALEESIEEITEEVMNEIQSQ